MPASARSKAIRDRVKRRLNTIIGNLDAGEIYDSLNWAMDRICERTVAKEGSTTITIVANTELYNFPDGFVTETSEPFVSGSSVPIRKLQSTEKVVELKRIGATVTGTADVPMYYYKLQGQIGFLNGSGTALSSAQTVTIYYQRKRLSTGAEDIGDNTDPLINSRWDRCLEYGAIYDLTNDPKWLATFNMEMQEQIEKEQAERDSTGEIESTEEVNYQGMITPILSQQ